MLIRQVHLEGIKEGSVSRAFRRWRKPAVRAGSIIKTSVGLVNILEVNEINEADLTKEDAFAAGFSTLESLLKTLRGKAGDPLFSITLSYHAPDPRIRLRESVDIEPDELSVIKNALLRLDQFSKSGPWTQKVLVAILQHPGLRAADLALLVSKEKEWLKLHVRKLKNLGLTISLEPGYEISPRGKEVIKACFD